MKKLVKALAVMLGIMMVAISVAACGGSSGSLYGTWTPESAEVNGSSFTVKELEALGDYTVSDIYMVLKEGGAAYVYGDGYGDMVEWSQTSGGVKLGELECAIKDGKIILENNGIKVTMAKTSDSQSIIADETEAETTAAEKIAEETTKKAETETEKATEKVTEAATKKQAENVEVVEGSEGLEYESNGDGTCTLVGIGKFDGDDLVIPSVSDDGDVITKIDEYAFYKEEFINLTLSNLSMEIDECAFQSCEVESLVISGCNLKLGDYAFEYCEELAYITFSDSTLEIGEYVFYKAFDDATFEISGCTIETKDCTFQSSEIVALNIDGSNVEFGDYAFEYCDKLVTVIVGGGTFVTGDYCFYKSEDLTDISIAEGTSGNTIEIGDSAFQSCKDLTSVVIGSGDVEIRDYAFEYCESLTTVVIEEGDADIGDYVFYKTNENISITVGGSPYKEK